MALRVVVVAAASLVWAAPAQAAPPTLLSVGHVKRHPQATWSLAPGAEARVVEVATSPEAGSDGYFFSENVKAFDTLESTQTHWLDSTALDTGTYYVHVATYDPSCGYDTCPGREWSNILVLRIVNRRPTISRMRVRFRSGYEIEAVVSFTYCDDSDETATTLAVERAWLPRVKSARARHGDSIYRSAAGCSRERISWYLRSRFTGVGWYSIRLSARDDGGAWSNTLKRTWYTRD